MFALFDTPDRTNMLLSYADQFREVPPESRDAAVCEITPDPQCEPTRMHGREAGRRDAETVVCGGESVGVSAKALAPFSTRPCPV